MRKNSLERRFAPDAARIDCRLIDGSIWHGTINKGSAAYSSTAETVEALIEKLVTPFGLPSRCFVPTGEDSPNMRVFVECRAIRDAS